MELIKLGLPKEENIVSRNKFIANQILPIGFKPANKSGTMFLVLFVASQDMDESCIYLQFMISINSKFEEQYLKNHELNIVNMKAGSKVYSTYKELVKDLNKSNLYSTDLALNDEDDFPLYYHSIAVRPIDNTHASVLDIYLNREYFVKLNIYLNRLNNIGHNHIKRIEQELVITKLAPELSFTDPKLNNIEFVSIEKIKHDATARVVTSFGTININHYTMWCGPSVFKMNYLSPIDKDHISIPLSNPLDINLYDAFYNKHNIIQDIFTYNDQLFILYEDYSDITGEFKNTKVLKISKELADKTNFIDYNNMIYEK